jgi:hypothetical protein
MPAFCFPNSAYIETVQCSVQKCSTAPGGDLVAKLLNEDTKELDVYETEFA